MKIAFEQGAFADFAAWAEQDRKIHKRIVTLILDIARNPHQGIGKPEPLKHELRGYWSRRITDEHRLVYQGGSGYLDHRCLQTPLRVTITLRQHPLALHDSYQEVLKHLHRLWGFTVWLESVDEHGKVELIGECPARG
jgi:toxin YoeB